MSSVKCQRTISIVKKQWRGAPISVMPVRLYLWYQGASACDAGTPGSALLPPGRRAGLAPVLHWPSAKILRLCWVSCDRVNKGNQNQWLCPSVPLTGLLWYCDCMSKYNEQSENAGACDQEWGDWVHLSTIQWLITRYWGEEGRQLWQAVSGLGYCQALATTGGICALMVVYAVLGFLSTVITLRTQKHVQSMPKILVYERHLISQCVRIIARIRKIKKNQRRATLGPLVRVWFRSTDSIPWV